MLAYYHESFTLLLLIVFLFMNPKTGFSKPEIGLSYEFTVVVPDRPGFGVTGRAFLMDSNQAEPKFRVALSVESDEYDNKYTCSLGVFLGDVKVWDSGHYSKFFVKNKCVVELTGDGDLRLTGPTGKIGWRTGTSSQGVKMLRILNNGNLVLVDGSNLIKWQSFNFPTNVMLLGQRLNVATRLTSFPRNLTSYYSFEIENDKIGLYFNSLGSNYSYWEFEPSGKRNMSFIKLGAKELGIFDDSGKKIARISSGAFQPLRFLALSNKTGNLGLYFYSSVESRFESSFRAINTSCDLPSTCTPYEICTSLNSCSCVGTSLGSNCLTGLSSEREFCPTKDKNFTMIELEDVASVLRSKDERVNVSREECAKLCSSDCKCASTSFESGICSLYGLVGGLKKVDRKSGISYTMVKVPKGIHHKKSNLKKWVLILIGIVDGLVILLVLGGLGYYLVRKKRRASLSQGGNLDN